MTSIGNTLYKALSMRFALVKRRQPEKKHEKSENQESCNRLSANGRSGVYCCSYKKIENRP
jgi:hypothetical protein